MLGLIAQIIVGVLTQGATLIAQMAWQAATAAAVAAASGGDFASVILAAGISFISVGAWGKVGEICKPLQAGGWGSNFAGNAESCALHGLVGGTLSAAEGGSFKDGFLSAAVSDACSGMVDSIEKTSNSQSAIMERSAAAGVVGGTAAVISGGNFIDGAKTAAFALMFSEEAKNCKLAERTESYFHNQYATAGDLAEAMGPNAVAFGIRPLDAVGDALDTDWLADHDLGVYHENVFMTDSKGRLYNFDYSPDGINSDQNFTDNKMSNYRFSDSYSTGSLNMDIISNPSGFSGSNYNVFTHNCQDYSDAVRRSLNIDSWHN